MKITVEQLKQLIREQVEESRENIALGIALSNKRVALASANEVIELMQAIKDKIQDVFQDKKKSKFAAKRLDAFAKLVVRKQNELEPDPMKKAQMMDMSDL